jgi:hypothetical protein
VIRVEHSHVVLPRLGAGQHHRPDRGHPKEGEVQVSVGADFAEQPHHAGPRAAIDSNQAEARDHRNKAGLEQGTKTIQVSWAQPSSSPDDHHDWSRRLQAEPAKRGHELAGLVHAYGSSRLAVLEVKQEGRSHALILDPGLRCRPDF